MPELLPAMPWASWHKALMRLCRRPACPGAQQQSELSLGRKPLSCPWHPGMRAQRKSPEARGFPAQHAYSIRSCPASGPGLLGGGHLGHCAEALVAGGGRAGLVGHNGVAVCRGHIGPCGRGAQAQLLCFDGARAQRIQALWRGPAWQRQGSLRSTSGPILATVNALCVLQS